MCSFYLDLKRPAGSEGSFRCRIPMVYGSSPRFLSSTSDFSHPQRTSRSSAADHSSKGASNWPFSLLPGLEAGSALKRRSTVSLLVVFKLLDCQKSPCKRRNVQAENARRSGHEIVDCFPRSGGYRDRTGDIQLAKLALSQLS